MKLFKPYKVLLILGNGFDLSLGLKTSYVNFMESYLFQKWVQINYYRNSEIDLHDRNLFNYLHWQKTIRNWIDVEEELKRYASKQRVEYHRDDGGLVSFSNVSDDRIKTSYGLLCSALKTYLKNLDYTVIKEDSSSLELLKTVLSKKRNNVITFNYTDVNKLLVKPLGNVEYIHGNINNDIILGFQRFNNMATGYNYMIKSENPHYKSCHLSKKMCEADEVIIFGHSLGETDHCYFKPFFEVQVSANAFPCKMTIITLNKDSRYRITQQMVALSGGQYQKFLDSTDVNVIEMENNEDVFLSYINFLKKRMRMLGGSLI